MQIKNIDYGEVTEFPQTAMFGDTCTIDHIRYVRKKHIGWVAFESAYDNRQPFDFGEVLSLPKSYGVVEGPLIPGDVCWWFNAPWKIDSSGNWVMDKDTALKDTAQNNGGRTNYYDIPEGAKTLNDLIEHKDMRFWQGECLKAIYALTDRAARATDGSSSEERELNKVVYYANRRLTQLRQEQKCHSYK